jgi:hypothetical protein
MMRRLATVLASALLMCLATAPGNAASLTKTYNNEVGFMTGPWDAPGIDYFDASLGRLTGVRIDYSAFVIQEILGAYWDDITGDFVDALLLYNVAGNRTIALNGSVLSFDFNQNGSYLFDLADNQAMRANVRTDDFRFSYNLSGAQISDFVGDGAITPETDLIYSYTLLDEIFPAGVVGAGDYSERESAFMETLTVTYTYVAAAVPEPASWGLMVVGFGAVGAAMRRRRTVLA